LKSQIYYTALSSIMISFLLNGIH